MTPPGHRRRSARHKLEHGVAAHRGRYAANPGLRIEQRDGREPASCATRSRRLHGQLRAARIGNIVNDAKPQFTPPTREPPKITLTRRSPLFSARSRRFSSIIFRRRPIVALAPVGLVLADPPPGLQDQTWSGSLRKSGGSAVGLFRVRLLPAAVRGSFPRSAGSQFLAPRPRPVMRQWCPTRGSLLRRY